MDISQINTLLRWCPTNHIEIDKRLRIVPDATGLAVYSGSASIGSLETRTSLAIFNTFQLTINSRQNIEIKCTLSKILLCGSAY